MDVSRIKLIVFDTFGTVVDWHSSVVKEGEALSAKYGFSVDWHEFADRWRLEGYIKAMNETAKGLRPYETVDVIHMKKLAELIDQYGMDALSAEERQHFNLIWHRLCPWPDVPAGLRRMKTRYMIGPFSNGDFRLLLDMARSASLPWDFILAGEQFRKFKPDPTIYMDMVDLLGKRPEEILMIAAHPSDLDGAKRAGCSTLFVPRPREYGEKSGYIEPPSIFEPDLTVPDFIEAADALGV